jgi:pSer/pThr/pTyr-binding forkhead associated (FHA) protein
VNAPLTLVAIETDETLLILKVVFLVLLYGFILMVVRSATKDIGGAPQESIVLGAAEAAKLRAELGARPARFRVVSGPGLRKGRKIDVETHVVLGRDPASDVRLDGDDYASARHARLETRPDGVWVEDLSSTNGTFVNGRRITAERLDPGDVVRVGQTELELES